MITQKHEVTEPEFNEDIGRAYAPDCRLSVPSMTAMKTVEIILSWVGHSSAVSYCQAVHPQAIGIGNDKSAASQPTGNGAQDLLADANCLDVRSSYPSVSLCRSPSLSMCASTCAAGGW